LSASRRRLRVAAAAALPLLAAAPAAAQEPAEHPSAKQRLERLVAHVEPLIGRYGYAAVGGVVALDMVGVPTPAASVMVAGTLAADRGELRVGRVASLALAAALLGSQIGYLLGRIGGRALLARLPLAPERLERLEARYRRWGALIVVWAPLVDGLRQLNGLTAGTLGMAWPRFTLANLLGCAVFVGLWVGGAWLLDRHLAAVAPVLHAARWWLIAAATVGVVAVGAWLWRRGADRSGAAVTRARTSG
jgi:membrane protein DedA with SNARE-associated domain